MIIPLRLWGIEMKKFLVILVLVFVGCKPSAGDVLEVVEERTECAWLNKHSICICYGKAGSGRWMTYVPDRVCGKNAR